MRTPARTIRLNPASSNATEYRPIGRLGKRYEPLLETPVDCGVISASPLIVTVAPGSTAPVESKTLPKISPVPVCADAARPDTTSTNDSRKATTIALGERLIHPPREKQQDPRQAA